MEIKNVIINIEFEENCNDNSFIIIHLKIQKNQFNLMSYQKYFALIIGFGKIDPKNKQCNN